ncbi:MAG: AbrB/MazE/SpoVT family DNA-binding domain-containing protein [Methylobacteriaceae bacterium]|nr:AbrB/MazE/SpoVT family DNA-binding domain-containing protein [Rhodoblastus sp.]MCC0005806.1 AbrB/MazE/SpoVT family DNA-binding domain-containing protein [Methylobacteriaceae bacterium]
MKSTLKITAKGQVTFRKDLLKELGVQPGDRIVVETVAPGRLEMRAAKSGKGISGFIGYFDNPDDIHLSIEDINEVIADSWAGGRGPWTPKR